MEITLLSRYARANNWMKELFSPIGWELKSCSVAGYQPTIGSAPVLVIYLDPLHAFEVAIVRSIRQTGYSGMIIGWIPGNTMPSETVLELINAGINSILPDSYEPDEAAKAVLECLEKGNHINHLISAALLIRCKQDRRIRNDFGLETLLTDRERKAILLRGEGKSAREIAMRLFVSKKTIDKLFWKLYQRTGHRNFFELYSEYARSSDGLLRHDPGSEEPLPATNSLK